MVMVDKVEDGPNSALNAEQKIEQLLAGVLRKAHSEGAHQLKAWKKPGDEIRRLVRRDYVRSLRRNLNYHQVKGLIGAFHEILPEFNRTPIGMMSPERFAEMAAAMRVHFKAAPYTGEEGLALRGFYVTPARGMLKKPLIYVNTAHHPLAVSTTFCHELGHHFSSQIFGSHGQPVHFFFDADYATHLEDASELAADVMVSFAGYPEPIARKIFATPWNWGLVARAKNLTEAAFGEVQGHLREVYGFDLMKQIPSNLNPRYLLGMIHYAKLRWALLAEYDL
jgi:hypothetical protein